MKRIIFMAVLALSFTACDNTKLQLRAAEPENTTATAGTVTQKSDSTVLVSDTLTKDSVAR